MNKEIMEQTITLSREMMLANEGGPFAAIIEKDGKIISKGWNRVTSLNDPTAHAEVVAIREACKLLDTFRLNGCNIYTSCEPCPMCLASIYWARLDQVFYANTREDASQIGFDDEFLYRELSQPIEGRQIPMTQILRNEALGVFRLWEKKEDKILY